MSLIRTPLGKFDYENGSLYDFSIVLTEYVRSAEANRAGDMAVVNVRIALERWTLTIQRKATPELTQQLDDTKAFLQHIVNELTEQLEGIEA